MLSNLCREARRNSGDSVFNNIPVGPKEAALFDQFLSDHDFSEHTSRAFRHDMRTFARWFSSANAEPFSVARVTVRDVTDFKNHLRRDQQQAVATVNRALVALRRFFHWLVEHNNVSANPVTPVKELRRQALAPKGLDRAEVRRLLREVELRQDIRATAIFAMFLYTGCRVSDLVALEVHDLMIADRIGSTTFRVGKGGKQRTVPLPLPCRKALAAYLDVRPPISSRKVFVGERGPLSDRGVRALCDRYSAMCGIKVYPHLLRHTMAHRYLADTDNDLVGLAQILGHESLNTTARYTQRSQQQLSEATERLTY